MSYQADPLYNIDITTIDIRMLDKNFKNQNTK